MERYQLKECALCGEKAEIQLSHIIPKFIGKHLKKTSIGNIRSMEDPNKTVQDLEKHYLLCHDCEERFSASERWFANNIFYPWKKNHEINFSYESLLHYFVTSLSWRSLYLDIMNYVRDGNIDVQKLNIMINSEKIMKEYLLKKRTDIGKIENHIFFFERIAEVEGENAEKFCLSPHTTIHRSVTSYTHYSENTIFTVSNLMGIILVTLYEKGFEEKWEATKINKDSGILRAEKQTVISVVCNEFQYWMEEAQKQQDNMSENQKNKIVQRMKEIGEDIINYDIYQDLLDDQELK